MKNIKPTPWGLLKNRRWTITKQGVYTGDTFIGKWTVCKEVSDLGDNSYRIKKKYTFDNMKKAVKFFNKKSKK